MASVFKQRYTTKNNNGEKLTKKCISWTIEYTTSDGSRKRVRGFKDKSATMQLAAKLEREAEFEQAGVIDKFKKYRQIPLEKHIEDFQQYLIDNGSTLKHANMTYQRAKALLDSCKFIFINDVQSSTVLSELAKLYKEKIIIFKDENGAKKKKIERQPLSIQSKNYYLKALKQFFNWMISDQRIGENPIAHLKCQNTSVDQKRKRRVLTEKEFNHLIKKTIDEPIRHALTGKERSMLYLLAANTGFRASELGSLCWNSFDFNSTSPTVAIKAAYSKHRKDDTQPLRLDIGELFKHWQSQFKGKPNERVFKVSKYMKWAEMLKKDLEQAGIEYINDSGQVFDFHALRHSFITNLIKGGASPKIAQELARHSDPRLTMGMYTHLSLHDQRSGLDALPALPDNDQPEINKVAKINEQVEKTYRDLTGNAYSGFQPSSLLGTKAGYEKQQLIGDDNIDKSLGMSYLGTIKKPLSSFDNSGLYSEDEGARTLNLRIDRT